MPNDPFCHAHSTSCKYSRHSFSTCVTDTATSRAHSIPQKMSSLSCTHRALPKNSACHAQSISSNCFPGHAPSTCVPNICHQWRTQHSSINVFACHAYIRYTNEPFCHAHSISCKYPRHSLSTCVTDIAISRAHSILLKMPSLSTHTEPGTRTLPVMHRAFPAIVLPCHAFSTCVPNTCYQWPTQHSLTNVFSLYAYLRSCDRTPTCHAHSIHTQCLLVMHTALLCQKIATSSAHSIFQQMFSLSGIHQVLPQ